MRTLGLDLAAGEDKTGVCAVCWTSGRATVEEPTVGIGDERLVDLITDADWIGIDAPFGWPEQMVHAVSRYATEGRWSMPAKEDFRYRRTDQFVRDEVERRAGEKLNPLSVSSGWLALAGWRAAGLRERVAMRTGAWFDRCGRDQVLEVYPAAALLIWGFERSGYKGKQAADGRSKEQAARAALLTSIEERASWLAWEIGARERCVESHDALDALLCALVARAGAIGVTTWPDPADDLRAAREGWIHLPERGTFERLGI